MLPGATYGHASVALGRLARIEAGLDNGVEITGFDLDHWRKGDDELVGFHASGAKVLRLRSPPDTSHIISRAMAEAGRPYASPEQIERMFALTASGEKAIGIWKSRLPPTYPRTLAGRYCSQVAAAILGLENIDVSPDDLSTSGELIPVKNAVVSDLGWRKIRPCPAKFEVFRTVPLDVCKPVAAAWETAVATAEQLSECSSADEHDKAVTALEARMKQILTETLTYVRSTHELENELFRGA
jgi:hypothetical protein